MGSPCGQLCHEPRTADAADHPKAAPASVPAALGSSEPVKCYLAAGHDFKIEF